MRFGALVLFFLNLALLAAVVLLGFAVSSDDRELALSSLGLMAFSAALFIAYRIFAARAYCPICRAPVLSGSGAQRNRNARRTFGSHRLRVARDILLTNSFVCPYCNEATLCTVRPRPKEGRVAKSRSSYRR